MFKTTTLDTSQREDKTQKLTVVHKCLMGNAPMYLQDWLQEHEGG